jgi:hypothetical protein
MSRKLISACMATAAFAVFAATPASSSAAPVITHPTGTVLKTGTLLKSTNVGGSRFTSATLNVECSTAALTWVLFANSTGLGYEGEITTATFKGTGTGEGCTATGSFFSGTAIPTPGIAGGLPWCLKNTLNDNFEIKGGACGSPRSIKFALDLGGITCNYEKTSLTGTFVTDVSGQDATGKITEGQKWTSLTFGCPSEPTLDMEFTQETDTSPASPVYISP